jgi:hypothetical protein
MNVLVLGGRVIGTEMVRELVVAFVTARFTKEERHVRRLEKMHAIEKRYIPSLATEPIAPVKRTPFSLFRNTGISDLQTNRLLIQIQPEEGISLRFGARRLALS